jgi:uncharacterized protein YggE
MLNSIRIAALLTLQAAPQTTEPVIATAATGEVQLPPEIAVVTLGVELREGVAARASSRMAGILRRTIDTLVTLGIPRDSLPTTRFVVGPAYDEEGNRISGYTATSGVRLTVTALDRLGEYIAAALAAGANAVSSLEFDVRDRRAARDEALRRAVRDARRDAEVLATAAGGTLGSLLELSTTDRFSMRGIALDQIVVTGVTGGVPVVPLEVTVSVAVATRWRYQPTPH